MGSQIPSGKVLAGARGRAIAVSGKRYPVSSKREAVKVLWAAHGWLVQALTRELSPRTLTAVSAPGGASQP